MQKSIKRLVAFLVMTFGLMYVSHGLIYLLLEAGALEWGDAPLSLLGLIGGGAPAFAALFVVFRMYSPNEQKAFWERVYLFRVPGFWWLVALASPLAIGAAANFVYHGGSWRPETTAADIVSFPLTLLGMVFAGGAEELGWRGILQDILAKKISLVVTGLVIGVLWAIWHGPLFLIDVFAHYNYAFLTYLLFAVLYSLLLTFVVHQTRSVLLAIVFHASINASGHLGFGLPMVLHSGVLLLLVVLCLIAAGVLAFVDGNGCCGLKGLS